MKRLALVLCALLGTSVFAAPYTAADIDSLMGGYVNNLNKSVLGSFAQENVYAKAWIGKVFPSVPSHFGLGAEASVVKLDMTPLNEIMKTFISDSVPKTLVFPVLAGNVRIGGIGLPFDIGVSGMFLNIRNIKFLDGIGFKYFNIGGDIRWALMQGKGLLPQLSLGAGYYYTKGGVFTSNEGLDTSVDYNFHNIFLQVQISKTFICVTPYLGFKAIFTNAKGSWNWEADSAVAAASTSFSDSRISGNGTFEIGQDVKEFFNTFIPQIYGGLGLNFAAFALNLCASWDFKNKLWGGNLSLRVQF